MWHVGSMPTVYIGEAGEDRTRVIQIDNLVHKPLCHGPVFNPPFGGLCCFVSCYQPLAQHDRRALT